MLNMRKENPARFSSAVGEAWMHCEFKVKYCHPIFDDEIYRESMRTLLLEAAYEYEIPVGVMGFDDNHVHFMADIGMYKREEVAKLLRGPTAKRFFEYFPEAKSKYFWGLIQTLSPTYKSLQDGCCAPLLSRQQSYFLAAQGFAA